MGQIGAQVQDHRRFQFTGVAHAAPRRTAVLFDGFGPQFAGSMQPGRGTKDAAVTFAGILDDRHQKGNVAAVSAHEIHFCEATGHQDVNHAQPEIFKGPAAAVESPGKGLTVGADPVGKDGEAGGEIGNRGFSFPPNMPNNQRIGGEGQVVAVLLGVADGDEDDFVL